MGYATMIRMNWRRSWLRSRPPCLPKGKAAGSVRQLSCVKRVIADADWLLLSRLEGARSTWFVQNACLTVFHHHNASLWGRDFSSLYSYIKVLGRVVTQHFSNRDNIIHPHAKIVDGTFLYLL